MIGIFGYYSRDGEAPVDLASMVRRHRAGYQIHAPLGKGAAIGRAGHRSDPESGIATDGGVSVVSLGNIFNTDTLIADAGVGSHDAASVILRLYRSGRLDRLSEANGQFCAALYDASAHRLTLITDRHALYPIHVWRRDGEVSFASLIYVLLGNEQIPRKANTEAIAQLFTMQRTIGCATSVAGVEALPAACIWQLDREGVREREYWQLRWRSAPFSERECAGVLDGAFRAAVGRMSRGKRPGLLLSGGIDSRWVLGAAPRGALSCWTTASFKDNPELKLARQIAVMCGSEHYEVIVEPKQILDVHDDTVVESNGLYPASPQFSAFMPSVAQHCDTVLSGHGLDYTLRGYYLPTRFLNIAKSHTRLPLLRPITRRPRGADVLYNLRQGPPISTINRIISKSRQAEWWKCQEDAMENILAPWLDSDDPYNAWDAFIMHAVSKHYAFTGMLSVRAVTNLLLPAFDADVIDVYLQMKPQWRVSGSAVINALRAVSRDLARLPNANTHFAADRNPWLDVASLVVRGGLRRLGLAQRHDVPTSAHSAGSWQNIASLYRFEAGHRARFSEIRGRLDATGFGMFDASALAKCIDEHLEGRAQHTKLMRQLLTHDAWARRFGISGHE